MSKDSITNIPATDNMPQKPQYIHEQHNTNCQQFFGPVTGCVFAMPGANVYQSPQAANTPSKAKPKKKRPAKADKNDTPPLTFTFTRKRGLTDQHLLLMLNILQREQWIMPESNPDRFIDLFSGKESDCHIIWNPDTGKGILRDLFRMMLEGGFIECPGGYKYVQIVESHFIYPNGQHVTGLKGGYTSQKAKNIIDNCRKVLLINPKASNYSDTEEIRELFSDIRYDG